MAACSATGTFSCLFNCEPAWTMRSYCPTDTSIKSDVRAASAEPQQAAMCRRPCIRKCVWVCYLEQHERWVISLQLGMLGVSCSCIDHVQGLRHQTHGVTRRLARRRWTEHGKGMMQGSAHVEDFVLVCKRAPRRTVVICNVSW